MTYNDTPPLFLSYAKNIFSVWPEGILLVNSNMIIESVNTKTWSMLGWKTEELIGKNVHEFLCAHASDYVHAAYDCPIVKLLNNGAPFECIEAKWVKNNGEFLHLDVKKIASVTDEKWKHILSIRENNGDEPSESVTRRLASFVFELDIPVADMDVSGNILYANPAMTNLLLQHGFNDQGTPAIMPPDLYSLIENCIQTNKTVYHTSNALEKACFAWNLYPQANRGTQFVKIIGNDITDLNKTRIELKEAKEEAEAATRAKSLFLANMSHELRTPMNAVLGFADLGLRFDNLPKKNQFLQKIKTSGQALLEIINDILDFSKIEAGKLVIEKIEFDPREHVEQICDLFAEMTAEKGIELVVFFDPAIPSRLMGDSLRFRQALINLGSNAIKFTAKGEVIIAVEFKKLVGDQVCLYCSVRDSGTGIPKESIPHLFKSFTQVDSSTTRKFGGTGLGLSITKSLVEMMDGQIGVESTIGEGSDFYFTAWFGISQKGTQNYYERSLTILSGIKILVVEEHGPTQNNLRKMMLAYGLDIDILSKKELVVFNINYFAQKVPKYSAIFCSTKEESWNLLRKLFAQIQMPEKNWPPIALLRYTNNLSKKETPLPVQFYLEKPIKHSELVILLIKIKTNNNKILSSAPQSFPDPYQGVKNLLRNKKFLVVDDNLFNQELIIEILKEAEIDYDLADNGKEAVEKACIFSFTGIFMDLHMPVMDGFEATERLRLIPNLAQVPIIGLTADIQQETKQKCLKAGMTAFLTKPYTVKALFKALSEIYEEKESDNMPTEPQNTAPLTENKIEPLQDAPNNPTRSFNQTNQSADEAINIQKALEMLGGRVPLLLKLSRLFINDFSDVSVRLKAALDSGDISNAQRIAHTTKGSAGNLAAPKLVETAAAIEHSLKENKIDIEHLMLPFNEAIKDVLVSLDEYIKKSA